MEAPTEYLSTGGDFGKAEFGCKDGDGNVVVRARRGGESKRVQLYRVAASIADLRCERRVSYQHATLRRAAR